MTDRQDLVIDPWSGISGDMMLGALVDLGADPEAIRASLGTLPIDGWHIEFQKRVVSGIDATDAKVRAEEAPTHRHLGDILEILSSTDLPPRVAERASGAFRVLAEAEGRVHGVSAEEVHFHEVGAVDAIVDIVGSAIALELLHVEAIRTRAISLGSGTVECAHGTMPVPVPATLELLRGFPVRQLDVAGELATPTGAAMVRAWSEPLAPGSEVVSLRVGYGAGDRQLENGRPNLLRLFLVRDSATPTSVVVLEAAVDDMTPEQVPFAIERLLEAGAVDAFVSNVLMKKGRPGWLFTAVGPGDAERRLAEVLLAETTTLGVRVRHSDRHVVARELHRIPLGDGTVAVKLSSLPGGVWRGAPEYEDCARLARETGRPVADVMAAAQSAATALAADRSQAKA